MLHDLRVALRNFTRHRSFVLLAVATLALGIAAVAIVASVLEAVVLRPLPYADSGRLVLIWSKWTAFEKTWLSELEFFDYQRESRTLEQVGAWTETAVNLTGHGDPERVRAGQVSAELLPVLGARPILGRVFGADEDRPGQDNVVLLGYGLWQRRYAGNPAIVGRAVQINGVARTVVGVMPAGFVLPLDFTQPEPTEVWIPLAIDRSQASRGSHYLYAVGRLKPGETAQLARAEIATIAARHVAAGEYPAPMRFEAFTVRLDDEVLGPVKPALRLLAIAVALLMLIASSNVANLFMVQGDTRQREMAVRTAIGASRRALVRQLLVESAVIATAGALLGVGAAWVTIRVIARWALPSIPRLEAAALDWVVVATTVCVTVIVSLVVGLLPAVQALRVDVTGALHEGAAASGTTPTRQRVRAMLVVAQVAIAVALTASAGLVARSLFALQRLDPGFRAERVLTMRVSVPDASYPEPAEVVAFYERLLARVRRLPGVVDAGAVRSLPLADTIGDFGLTVEGAQGPDANRAKGDWQVATDGSFEALGERLVRGRWFGPGDRRDTPLVAVVNQTLANTYWPAQDVIGKRLKIGRNPARPWVTVVGIVGDERHNGITAPVKEKFYIPHAQWDRSVGSASRSMVLTVKTVSDPAQLLGAIREQVRAVDPAIPVSDVRTMDEVLAATTATPRFATSVLGAFAVLALLLAAVGVYAVLSSVVSRRTREIGLRVALGAETGDVRHLVLRQALEWGLAGATVGILLSVIGAGVLRSVVYGVTATDPLTLGLGVLVILSVTAIAAMLPARRAARIDPMRCLKLE